MLSRRGRLALAVYYRRALLQASIARSALFRERNRRTKSCGDRAPFATSGRALRGPTGYKIIRIDPITHRVEDFVFNPSGGPASKRRPSVGLERPIDVKFGPDGAMYILDFGKTRIKNGQYDVESGSGRIYRLIPTRGPAGQNVP